MYSISPVNNRRHGFFRLVNPLTADTTGPGAGNPKTADTVIPNEDDWEFSSGILNSSSGSYPVTERPTSVSTAQFDEAWDQATGVLTCMEAFFTDPTNFMSSCSF